jgi:TPR repeat
MARRPGWERPISEGGATWIHFGANIAAADGELSLQSASDDLRQLTKAELVRAGQAPDVVAPKTLVPSGETRTSTAPADAMSPWSAAIRCSICRKTGGLTRSMPMSAGRLTEHPDVLDYLLRGRAAWWKSPYATNYTEVLGLFERALALDPRAVEAQIWLALMLINRVIASVSDSPDVDLQRADELVAQALALSPDSAWAHYVNGQVLRAQSQYEDASIEYETAIAFDRNLANAYAWLGRCKLLIGSLDKVIPPTEYAIRLSLRDRNLAPWYWQIGAVHLLKARTDEAVSWFEKARSAHAGIHFIHASVAAGYALEGETGAPRSRSGKHAGSAIAIRALPT